MDRRDLVLSLHDAGRMPARFILGADCTLPADTPRENVRTAIDAAHAAHPPVR